jgi:hypothetical protein
MARNLQKKVVLCDSYDPTTGTPGGNVQEILLEDSDPMPKTVAEVEVLVESGKVASKDLTKCRTIVANMKADLTASAATEEAVK